MDNLKTAIITKPAVRIRTIITIGALILGAGALAAAAAYYTYSPSANNYSNTYSASNNQANNQASVPATGAVSAVKVTTPNGGEGIVKGYTSYTIWWDNNWSVKKGVNNVVDIFYRRTTGVNQMNQPIAKGIASQNESYGYYNWAVPEGLEDGTYRITVTAWGYGTNLSDSSNADSSIISSPVKPTLTVLSPNDGEKWAKEEAHLIVWKIDGAVPKVSIMLEDINNKVWPVVDKIENGNSYKWSPAKDLPLGMVKIRVSGNDYSPASDISDAYFFLYEKNDTIAPGAPTNIVVGRNSPTDPVYRIKFDYTLPNDPDYYCINIYRSSYLGEIGGLIIPCVGRSYKPGGNTGYFPFFDDYIYDSQRGGRGQVFYTLRAVDLTGNESKNKDQYSYAWGGTIQASVSGSSFKIGDTLEVRWTMSGIVGPAGRAEIWLYKRDEKKALIKSGSVIPPSPNVYSWTIPENLNITTSSSDYKIRVLSPDYPPIYGETGYFTIWPKS